MPSDPGAQTRPCWKVKRQWPPPRSAPSSSREHWDHSEKWLLQFSEGPVLLLHTACTPFCWGDSFVRTDPVIWGQGAGYRFIVIMKAATPKPRAAVVQAQGPYGCSCDTADAWGTGNWLPRDLPERNTLWQPPWLCGKSRHGTQPLLLWTFYSKLLFLPLTSENDYPFFMKLICFKPQIKKGLRKDYNNVRCCYVLIYFKILKWNSSEHRLWEHGF